MSSTVINCDLVFFSRHHQSHGSLIPVDLRSNVISLYDSLCSVINLLMSQRDCAELQIRKSSAMTTTMWNEQPSGALDQTKWRTKKNRTVAN